VSVLGRNTNLTMTGAVTIALYNVPNGGIPLSLIVTPNSSTDYVLTLPSGYYYANDHSNTFNIEGGTGTIYHFTFRYNGSITLVDYATYSN